jgi:hypothetical protein
VPRALVLNTNTTASITRLVCDELERCASVAM